MQLDLKQPSQEKLEAIVAAHLGAGALAQDSELMDRYRKLADQGSVAPDLLLNALFLLTQGGQLPEDLREKLSDALLHPLSATGS